MGTDRKKPEPAAVAEEAARILSRLASAPMPWLSRGELLDGVRPSAVGRAALSLLQASSAVMGVGRVGNATYFAALDAGGSVPERLRVLASAAILSAAQPGPLRALPVQGLRSGAKRLLPGVPSAVRGELAGALEDLLAQQRAFWLDVEGRQYILLRPDLEATLASPVKPASDGGDDPTAQARIDAAYQDLRLETGLRNVPIAALLERSGVELSRLHHYLYARCHERRANATLGEPSVASAAELSAALMVDGQPHVYIELC